MNSLLIAIIPADNWHQIPLDQQPDFIAGGFRGVLEHIKGDWEFDSGSSTRGRDGAGYASFSLYGGLLESEPHQNHH